MRHTDWSGTGHDDDNCSRCSWCGHWQCDHEDLPVVAGEGRGMCLRSGCDCGDNIPAGEA